MQIKMHITNQPPLTPTETLLPLPSTTCHHHHPPPPTPIPTSSSQKPHLYFAYGSNLSPTQMAARCTINPSHSAKPLALASLSRWRWHINEAGYANVLPPRGLRISSQLSPIADRIPVSGCEDAVYGVLYEMDQGDERILDGYEGIDREAEVVRPEPGEPGDGGGDGNRIDVDVRPKEQGEGDYNKWYIDAEVVKWLDEEARRKWLGLEENHGLGEDQGQGQGQGHDHGRVRVLVYVDEERVVVSKPNAEYIPRMNRAMREAEGLGVSGRWLEEVLRRFIPEE